MSKEIHVGAEGPYHAPDASVAGAPAAEVWLCRCGRSASKPFCDGSHRAAGFTDPGVCVPGAVGEDLDGDLTVAPLPNGPLLATGAVVVKDATGAVVFRGAKVALCRCGQSKTKPFCDATHRGIGFTAP